MSRTKWRRCRGRCHKHSEATIKGNLDRIELGKRQVQQSQWGSKYVLNEDMSMKAKLASMARRIEEFELRNVHTEAQPQAMPTSFEYINHPNLTTQPQPQSSMSTSSLEQAILKISKVMEDFVEKVQDSIEKLTNLDIAREKGSFLLNPTITFKEPMQKIKESVDDRHFASTSPGKRREMNSLGPNGKDANFVWDPGGIQHEVGNKGQSPDPTHSRGHHRCISSTGPYHYLIISLLLSLHIILV
ncbi:hypothetical protein AAG906_032951 [Vitis piasezkii]